MIKYMAVAVAVAVSGGVGVPVAVLVAAPVAGLTKRLFNQKDFLINVCGYQHFFKKTLSLCNFVAISERRIRNQSA